MTPFTLVMAYYDNPRMLAEHVWKWTKLPEAIRGNLHVIIVDDGSPNYPAFKVETTPASAIGLASFQLWRMGVDVPWNMDACRNVGVREAPTPWVLLTDMDHVVPPDTWYRMMRDEKLKKNRVYRFSRVNAPALDPYKPHPNSWAITRDSYWLAGGYDEALAGNYGSDGDFLVRVQRACELIELRDAPLIRYPRDVIADASTTTLERKNPIQRENIKAMIRARATNPTWKPLHFSFPCERLI